MLFSFLYLSVSVFIAAAAAAIAGCRFGTQRVVAVANGPPKYNDIIHLT